MNITESQSIMQIMEDIMLEEVVLIALTGELDLIKPHSSQITTRLAEA